MSYVALKPCQFAGQKFKIGNEIPQNLILPGAAKNLVKMEVIANAGSVTAGVVTEAAQTISVVVHADEGDLQLELTAAGIQQIFDALTDNVEGAVSVVDTMTDEDALILLHMSDSRKGVKTAAEARAKALTEEPEEPADDETSGDEPEEPADDDQEETEGEE